MGNNVKYEINLLLRIYIDVEDRPESIVKSLFTEKPISNMSGLK
jgi:hypothetical protein